MGERTAYADKIASRKSTPKGRDLDEVFAPRARVCARGGTAGRSGLGGAEHALDVHRAVSKGFAERGYRLGHVTGHSIGMTMIEFPKIGEGVETELQENMVLSMHPHAIAENGHDCLYMQETWLVGPDGGIPLSGLPSRIYGSRETA